MTARLVVAGTGSGVGKTTVTSGLIGALRAAGHTVQGFKVGPDYIDPSFHALASGRPGRNLDAFLSGPELIAPLFLHGAAGAEISVIEGVMGLFDGASGRGELASSAHVAKLLDAPVVLVVDGKAMARSAAAVLKGFVEFDPEVRVAGVIFNRVGSAVHEGLLREAADLVGVEVLGCLRRSAELETPERHLGLVPAGESKPDLSAAAAAVSASVDLERVVALARAASPLSGAVWEPTRAPDRAPVRVAIARGPAFSFHYQENLELLEAAGAELVGFDPISDRQLPAGSAALLLAGGFPEVYGEELSANTELRAEIKDFNGPILGECGGLLYLGESLDGHEMCGRLALTGQMAGRLTLGYREASAATATPWLDAGETVRGHEFHYSSVSYKDGASPAWRFKGREDGMVDTNVQAGYLHVHWAAHPQIPARFLEAAR